VELLVFLFGWLVIGLLPHYLITHELIERRAKAAGVRPCRYQLVSVFSQWIGLVVTPAFIAGLIVHEPWFRGVGPLVGFGSLGLLGWVGGTLGACAGVWYLRMQTARHPDFEDLRGPPSNSLEAHVPQPRDGDHVRPH
jgi:hypothetical protein